MNNFTDEEVKAAKATRDAIISGDIEELKSVYMAGEIVMWDELRQVKNLNLVDVSKSVGDSLKGAVCRYYNQCNKVEKSSYKCQNLRTGNNSCYEAN